LICGLAGSVFGDEKANDGKGKADPASTPLALTITGKTTKYTLDTGSMTPEEYKKAIEAAAGGKALGRPPAPPAVDLVLELKNTSDKAVMVWTKGDPVVITLDLKGKGAANAMPLLAFTTDFRLPEAVEIAAGKTYEFPLKSLTSGFRGASKFSYWTAPGDYELTATLKTGMSPAPKGAKEDMDGFGTVTVSSPAFKITVEAKQ
jgi:hypothetical protein